MPGPQSSRAGERDQAIASATGRKCRFNWTGRYCAVSRPYQGNGTVAGHGRVEMWRGDGRLGISVSAPFVWRCLTGAAEGIFVIPPRCRAAIIQSGHKFLVDLLECRSTFLLDAESAVAQNR